MGQYETIAIKSFIKKEERMSEKETDPDQEKLTVIFEKLESHDGAKMTEALDEIFKNAESIKRVEERYLTLIRVLLDDESASLKDFPEALGNPDVFKDALNEVYYGAVNKLEFVYLSDEEMRNVVDIIGAIVKTHISADQYVEAAKEVGDLKDLADPLFSRIKALKVGIDREVNAYAAGWYGQICIQMMKAMIHGIELMVFLKSWMEKANHSKVLKEFNFFLGAASQKGFIIVEMRNIMDCPFDFSEIFWLMPNMPVIWFPEEQEPLFPECVLSFNRTCKIMEKVDFYDAAGTVDHSRIVKNHPIININSDDLKS